MVEFEVQCDDCGGYLDADFRKNTLEIDICKICLEYAKDEAYEQGKEEGEKTNL